MGNADDILLRVEHLSMRFGGLVAVDDLSFTARQGNITALIGPNGAGKTTALRLISGFLAPDAGEIRFRGRSIRGLPPHRVCALGMARRGRAAEDIIRHYYRGVEVRRLY